MTDPEFWRLYFETLLEVLTFLALLTGLFGLLIPVFPGLTVMWIATLVYGIIQMIAGNMTWVTWLLFVFITLLMIGGNIVDNIIIAKHMRDKDIPWSSILLSFAAGIIVSLFLTPLVGIIASPVRRVVHAVENVSFAIMPGETLGLVGESGSGKSTTGRAILRRVPAAAGRILYRERDITHVGSEGLRPLRRHMQLVLQDPYASQNPRMRVVDIVAEPLVVHGLAANRREAAGKVAELMQRVGLPPDAGSRYPHAFSGGQRQRVGIARALALNPEFIVADEPVSALDVSIRAQSVNLMQDLQRDLGIAYLFIAHDLAVVRHISHVT